MNLLITGAWQQAKDYIPKIEKKHNVEFLQQEKDELPCDPSWVEGIIGNGIFLSHSIEEFTNLHYIQLTSAGFDRVPMGYVKEKGIRINNARGVYSIPMAEYALSGVLVLYKKLRFFTENQKVSRWEKERNLLELYGKEVCILGCGSVGTECALRFEAMGCTVYGVASSERMQAHFSCVYSIDDLKFVLGKSDVVIITLPLKDETRGMFGAEVLRAVKDGAVLVNIARGALIKTEALLDELKSGRISAVLDVFEEEPLSEDSELWSLENVIITPHNSFVGEGNGKRMSDVIMRNLEEYNGQVPKELQIHENSGCSREE